MLYILDTVATNLPLRNLEKNHYLALKYVFSWKLRPNCIFLKVAVPYTSQWATILLFYFCSAIYLPLGHRIFSQCHILTSEPPLQCHIIRPIEFYITKTLAISDIFIGHFYFAKGTLNDNMDRLFNKWAETKQEEEETCQAYLNSIETK